MLSVGWWDVATWDSVKQCRVNVVYFNIDMNNVRQRWNNVLILNVELKNVVKMTVSKKNEKKELIQTEDPKFKVLTTIS